MATVGTSGRNAACDAIVDLIDGGSASGKLRIRDSSNSTLVDIALNDPAFGDASAGVATLDVDPALSGSPSASGTADHGQLLDSDNNVVIDALTVGTSGAEINLDSLSIQTGVDVSITSGTITMPAS